MNPKLQKLLQRHNKEFKIRRHFKPSTERIINRVAEETGVSKKIIYQIVSSQFLMIKETVYTSIDEKGLKGLKFDKYKSIRLIYLGAFLPSRNKFNKLIKKLKGEKEANV